MATDVCFYFQVHQPWRLRTYRFLEVGKSQRYFDDEKNAAILRKVAAKCYLPMNRLLLGLIEQHGPAFKAAFSISGTVIQQLEAYAPEVLQSFRQLFATGQVELLAETSHHSLAALHSPEEFTRQVQAHQELCTRHLIPPSRVFRNTELIMSNGIARQVATLGFEAFLMEGADHVLRGRSPLSPYQLQGTPGVVALAKNYRLSDDIAFRFSDRQWAEYPLTPSKFAGWISDLEARSLEGGFVDTPFVGLFMDYETFGEHQWEHTGIFAFMRALPAQILGSGQLRFVTPTEAARAAQARMRQSGGTLAELDVPVPFSWADTERDLSAWEGNSIQDAALRSVYRLEPAVRARAAELDAAAGANLLETWRRLLTSDHFYYMCTKHFADGDVHKYFNPYDSPYDAHIIYMNVIADLTQRLGVREQAIA